MERMSLLGRRHGWTLTITIRRQLAPQLQVAPVERRMRLWLSLIHGFMEPRRRRYGVADREDHRHALAIVSLRRCIRRDLQTAGKQPRLTRHNTSAGSALRRNY